jgi:hypothetical protein
MTNISERKQELFNLLHREGEEALIKAVGDHLADKLVNEWAEQKKLRLKVTPLTVKITTFAKYAS